MKQVVVADCKACEENYCYSISNETDNKEKFEVHTHSYEYKEHLQNYAALALEDIRAGLDVNLRYVA